VHWLITGGCGFIGANLVAGLLAETTHTLRILDSGTAGAHSLAELGLDARRLDVRRADVRDRDAVREAAAGADVIVHLAGASGVAGSLANPHGDASANVLGTLNVLEAAKRTGARVVFASTTGPLIGPAARIDEATLPSPSVPYGASKLAAEAYCHAYARSFGVASCVLRLTNVYGPGSGHKAGAVSRFLADGRAGRALTITGDGRQTRDFLYVADAVSALRRAAMHPAAPGQTFQIATGRAIAINELAAAVRDLVATHGLAVPALTHTAPRPAEIPATDASPAKARARLGWRADVGLADGLAATFAWLSRQLEHDRRDWPPPGRDRRPAFTPGARVWRGS
jgi:UDP-glucose 4-epimerase